MVVDETELCELVGFYLLDLLTKKFDKQNISLYRDDGLSCFENICPDPQKIKKKQNLQKQWIKHKRRMWFNATQCNDFGNRHFFLTS